VVAGGSMQLRRVQALDHASKFHFSIAARQADNSRHAFITAA
jgi:hypothetical protein